MADIDLANTFNETRGYEDWSDLSPTEKSAALLRADDYIAANYNIRSALTEAEQGRYLQAKFTLARELGNRPVAILETATVKKESKEGAGFKKEVEYNAPPLDPYPNVTRWLAPLLRQRSAGGVLIGRLIR